MLKALGKKITNNFGLKILAALFAVVLWVVVVNIDDPLKTRPYTTSVLPINDEYITSQGKYYEWLDGKNTITFNVSATRSIWDKLSSSDFSATADMEKIEYDEKNGTYRVPVSVATSKYNSSQVTISSKQLYLEVVLEDLGTCQKAISANTRGNVADGCALGRLQIVGSNLLKISGPSSIVSQIDAAVATINVDGMSTDVTDSVVPVLYDADGNVIDTTKLTLSLNTVTISAQILNTKDVALEFQTSGEAASGYMVTGLEYGLETVRIKGETATLNPVNKITIPAEVLDITGITEDLVTTVDISSYLPSGTSLVLSSDAKVEVAVRVEPLITKTLEVPVANLMIENLREGYVAEYGEDTIAVEIGGAQSVVSEMKAKDILGTANASGLGAGEHYLSVDFVLDSDLCWTTHSVKVLVNIVGNSEAPGDTSGEEASGGQQSEDADDSAGDTGNSATGNGTGTATGSGAGTATGGGTGTAAGSGTGTTTGSGSGSGTGTAAGSGTETGNTTGNGTAAGTEP